MVGRGIDSIYRCRKIVKICEEGEHSCTHQPFDLGADVTLKERSQNAFRRKTLNLSMAGGYRPSLCDGQAVTPTTAEDRLAFWSSFSIACSCFCQHPPQPSTTTTAAP